MPRWMLLLACLAGVLAAAEKRPIERFQRMTPQQRARTLDKLPPARRQNIERRLAHYDRLPAKEKARLQRFSDLPPERQDRVRRAYNGLTRLPPARQSAVRDELRRMRGLPSSERDARISSPGFRDAFRPHEQRLIEELRDLPE